MLYKNIKHASTDDIKVLNEIKDISFNNDHSYFLIAKKDELYAIRTKDGFNLIIDKGILDLLVKENKIGGIK